MSVFAPGSVAFVTGASSGIGLATAKCLVGDGIKKIALIDVSEERLSEATASICAIEPSVDVLKISADCSKEAQVDSAVEETVKRFGRLDICVNAAGISGEMHQMAEATYENLQNVIGVNLLGVWLCQRAQIRQMMKQEMRDVTTGLKLQTRGSIVNIGSLVSHKGLAGMNPYAMAKHGVLGLSRSDTLDYASKGIRINCICPGWIQTNMTKVIFEDPQAVAVGLMAPMGRWGIPDEIAFTASFLLSDRASFISGAPFNVDGGMSAA